MQDGIYTLPGAMNKTVPKRSLRFPFLNSNITKDMKYFLGLWPLWWIAGLDQLLPSFFFTYMAVRVFIRKEGKCTYNSTTKIALFLAIWWVVPLGFVDLTQRGLFLYQWSTACSQALVLFIFWNAINTKEEWDDVAKGLLCLAVYVAIGGAIFALDLWRGQVESFLGIVLPGSLTRSSAFFNAISFRGFGSIQLDDPSMEFRVTSFNNYTSALSMTGLILLPFMVWWCVRVKSKVRYVSVLVTLLLLVTFYLTKSRAAYLALMLGTAALAIPSSFSVRKTKFQRFIFFSISASLILAMALLLLSEIETGLTKMFVMSRATSWLTRFRVYKETIMLIPKHPIVGWGQPVRIPGMLSVYSAGSHSSYLGMLFQHGVVGLMLYLALWISVWKRLFVLFRQKQLAREWRLFARLTAVGLLSFNLREVADCWWFDQLLSITLWTMWGLILTLPKCLGVDVQETQCVA